MVGCITIFLDRSELRECDEMPEMLMRLVSPIPNLSEKLHRAPIQRTTYARVSLRTSLLSWNLLLRLPVLYTAMLVDTRLHRGRVHRESRASAA